MRCASPPASVPDDAVEREVVEADVEQELQPLVDLLDHALGDHAGRARRARASPKNVGRLADRQLADLVDVLAADRDRERRRLAGARRRTRGTAPRACSPRSARATRSLSDSVWRRSSHGTTPSYCVRVLSAGGRTGSCSARAPRLAAGAVQHDLLLRCFFSFFHGVSMREAVLVADRVEHPLEVLAAEARPRRDRALVDREVVVGRRRARGRPRSGCRGRRSARTRRTAS